MASRDSIGADMCSLVGNTPMVYLNRVTDGCKARIGECGGPPGLCRCIVDV
jgi:hypothetical protein